MTPPSTPHRPLPAPARPLVTVGIPAYDRPELLRQALASLAEQENFDDFEVVVCDDLGRAATRAIVEQSQVRRIRYVRNQQPLGAVENWNQTLREASGDWVTVLHEDDLLYPWFFDLVRAHLRPGKAAVAVRCARGAEPPPLARPVGAPTIKAYRRAYFLKSAFTPFPGVLFPRQLALALGGFDPACGPLADYEFWYRLSGYGDIAVMSATAAFYRVAEGQWTQRAWPEMLRRTHLLRLRMAREQLPSYPRLGRTLARVFTVRNAREYTRRYDARPLAAQRVERLWRSPWTHLPSGWAWWILQRLAASSPVSRVPTCGPHPAALSS